LRKGSTLMTKSSTATTEPPSPRTPPPPKSGSKAKPGGTYGPIGDLESHLPPDWWRELFDSLYLRTDGDVVENDTNTAREVDMLVQATGVGPGDKILDLCCGQGRHAIELARRGFEHVTGIDRSRYLIRLARRRASKVGLAVAFREGDARNIRLRESSIDCVCIMGNSFGYFDTEDDDVRVLEAVKRVLRSGGSLVLDLADGEWVRDHFDRRSWEWIDQNHFVCRERSLTGDEDRLVSREVVVHSERGVIADQFYAERLYSHKRINELLERVGFRNVRTHGYLEADSDRGQDLGMMVRRLFLTADAPRKQLVAAPKKSAKRVTVILGDPRLPDTVKRGGQFNAEDIETVERLKDALADIPGYIFQYLDNHATLTASLKSDPPEFVFNLCDEGFNNDAFMELHVPALLETLELPYTGAGPACLATCYDKALVRALAASLDIPVPLETFVRAGDQSATIPSTFPALLKPNFGDSSLGITRHAVVANSEQLIDYMLRLREELKDRPILVQEFLTGPEYSVALIGNPGLGLTSLPVLEVDYTGLDANLPRILGYESKWLPDSPYWNQIRYREAEIDPGTQRMLTAYSSLLFERLRCRDYARFDFRVGADGQIRLLEVNPNPGWCWDGKFNLMAGFAGMSYPEVLRAVLDAANERISAAAAPSLPAVEAQAEAVAV
jgi:D-alanine-D-alanine ligase